MPAPDIQTQLISPLVMLLGSLTSSYAVSAVKWFQKETAKWPAPAKQALVIVASYAVQWLAAFLNLPMFSPGTALTAQSINTVFMALLAFGVYNLRESLSRRSDGSSSPTASQ